MSKRSGRVRILLTNDDGVEAPGLLAVRHHLLSGGASVVTIAPGQNCSGLARACTFSRPVAVRQAQVGADPVYVTDGTPTDCVRVGLLGGIAPDVDLVVSGINHGANLADDVRYSGTIAAGMEAADLNISALCVSQQNPTGSFAVNHQEDRSDEEDYDFGVSAPFAADLALSMVAVQPEQPIVLSVNVPAGIQDVSCAVTHPARRLYASHGAMTDRSGLCIAFHGFGRPGEEIAEQEDDGQTDIAALRAGTISITPITVFNQKDTMSEPHREFFQRLLERSGGG